jgi:hypothetical protein
MRRPSAAHVSGGKNLLPLENMNFIIIFRFYQKATKENV